MLRGADDWVGAWEVASVVESMASGANEVEVRDSAFLLIRQVLSHGLMEIGDVAGTGSHPVYVHDSCRFQPWGLPVERSMERVEQEWNALGRSPTLGEVCWLNLTEKGQVQAHALRSWKDEGGS